MSKINTTWRGALLSVSVVGLLLSAQSIASAQVYRDDPPGSAFESRGIDDEAGLPPGGDHPPNGAYAHVPTRHHRVAHAPAPEPTWGPSSALRDHLGQCWFREGGGGHDLSGYWGPCK